MIVYVYFYFLLFLVVSFIIFFGFGLSLLNLLSIKLSGLEKFVLSTVTGLVIFTLLIYLFSYLNLRWLVTPTVSLIGLWGLHRYQSIKALNFRKINIFLAVLLFLGIAGQGALIFPSGLKYENGFGFYGVNVHDGIWHTSLITSLSNNFPPKNYTISDQPLQNYHFLSDLLGSELHQFFKFSVLDLNFRFFPLLYSLLLGLSVFILTRKLTGNNLTSLLAVFLSFFCGSLGFIPSLLKLGGNTWESSFWSIQSISFILNSPLIPSFVILLSGIFLLNLTLPKPNFRQVILISLLFGSLIGFKAYGGVLILITLAILAFYNLSQKRFEFILIFIFSLLISLILFLPSNPRFNSTFIFQPGWFIQTMMVAPDRLNNVDWELRRQTYLSEGNIKRVVQLWVEGLLIFLAGNLGIRLLGFYQIVRGFKKFNITTFSLLAVTILGITIPLLFVQNGVAWNTIQFFYYSLLILNIFTAIFLSSILKSSKLPIKILLIIVLILFTIPTTLKTISTYINEYQQDPSFLVNNSELEALSFLQNLPQKTVLSSYHDTSYLSTFTGKPVFFEDQTQAELLGYVDGNKRQDLENQFFCQKNSPKNKENFLSSYNIGYVYIKNSDVCKPQDLDKIEGLKKIFDNSKQKIFEFN